MTAALTLSLFCLFLSGLAPSLAAADTFGTAFFLAPLVGGLLAGAAALLTALFPGSILIWWLVVSSAATAASLVALKRGGRLHRRPIPRPTAAAVASFVFLGTACAYPLSALRRVDVFYDARSIWFLHARYIDAGHETFDAALKNSQYVFSHPDYPPLVSATAASVWRVTRSGYDYRLAQVVVGVLNVCAVALIARAIQRISAGHGPVVAVSGHLAGAAVVLCAFGIAGRAGSDGYADLLWSASVVAACCWGLVAPPSPRATATAVVLCLVGGDTKNEGLALAGVVLLLVAARTSLTARRQQGWPAALRRRATLSLATGIALIAWPVFAHLDGVVSDVAAGGNVRRLVALDPSVTSRLSPTLTALADRLHLVVLAVVLALLASLGLTRQRRHLGWAGECWLALVALAAAAALTLAYLLNPISIDFLIPTSMDRTTIFLRLLAITDVALWFTVVSAALIRSLKRPSSGAEDMAEARAGERSSTTPIV